MKKLFILILSSLVFSGTIAQVKRVAILDFDNISGISKYDGLGKAMSSMLISDIEANVSPKRLQLVERAQIQKILKEQKFQMSGSVDKNSSIKAGKILGVSYLLVGDVYVLNDDLVVNARLTDAETGDIVFSKKQEGKTLSWLKLKTEIAKQLASQFSLPFTEPVMPDQQFALATLTTFGNAVAATDNGDFKKAEELSTTVKDFSPDFKYVEDLSKEIEGLKARMDKVEDNVTSLQDAFLNLKNIYFDNPKTEAQFLSNAYIDKRNGKYAEAIANFKGYFKYGSKFMDPYLDFLEIINLAQFRSEKSSFEDGLKDKSDLISQILKILNNGNSRDKANQFVDLKANYPKSGLVNYFYLKEIVYQDKTNPPARISCTMVNRYQEHYADLIKLNTDTSYSNYFIDVIRNKKDFDDMTTFIFSWADILNKTIGNLKKGGMGLGNIALNINNAFDCSTEQISAGIVKYLIDNGKDTTSRELSGKFFRHENGKVNKLEFIDFGPGKKSVWRSENINTEWSYGIIGKNIILSGNGSVYDLNLISEDEVKFIQRGFEYVYRR